MPDQTPPKPCTVREDADCDMCTLPSSLNCRWDKSILNGFIAIAIPTFIGTLVMLALLYFLTGQWWPAALYIVYVVLVFLFEFRFLCSHCPYYAAEGKILHCIANNGAPKIWKYNPLPMTHIERFLMYFLVLTLYLFIPVICGVAVCWLIYAGGLGLVALTVAVGALILTLSASVVFQQVMKIFYCCRCVNFSCPLNTVEKEVVDDYLRKNRVMREAWEKTGYILSEE